MFQLAAWQPDVLTAILPDCSRSQAVACAREAAQTCRSVGRGKKDGMGMGMVFRVYHVLDAASVAFVLGIASGHVLGQSRVAALSIPSPSLGGKASEG